MGPYGMLANECVRRLTARQFAQAEQRDGRDLRSNGVAVQRRSRLRKAARGCTRAGTRATLGLAASRRDRKPRLAAHQLDAALSAFITAGAAAAGVAAFAEARQQLETALERWDRVADPAPLPSSDGKESPAAAPGLTTREQEVLALLGRGRTNNEIGADLVIRPKTASVHVTNIMRKLGVRRRVEAAGVAHRLGLLD